MGFVDKKEKEKTMFCSIAFDCRSKGDRFKSGWSLVFFSFQNPEGCSYRFTHENERRRVSNVFR